MPRPTIEYQTGSPFVTDVWEPLYRVLETGVIDSVSENRIVLVDVTGDRLIFSGSFILTGEEITGGTVTGFSVRSGAGEVMQGYDYSFSVIELLDALVNVASDDDAFWELIWDAPLNQVGSDLDDTLWGNPGGGTMSGGLGNDQLWGWLGNETLKGGLGNDLLSGGDGVDTLFGGKGRDAFVISDLASIDRIADFAPKADMIAFGSTDFAKLGTGSLSRAEFVVGRNAKTAAQQVIYNDKTGALYYDADGSGANAKVQIATLDPHLDLSARHFFMTGEFTNAFDLI